MVKGLEFEMRRWGIFASISITCYKALNRFARLTRLKSFRFNCSALANRNSNLTNFELQDAPPSLKGLEFWDAEGAIESMVFFVCQDPALLSFWIWQKEFAQ